MTGREKWTKYLAGEDVGEMVCPLCDKWGAGDIEYGWRGEGPEPFGDNGDRAAFRGQLMMAKTFGWDSLFYAAINFQPNDKNLLPAVEKVRRNGRIQTVSVIRTPRGDLTRIDEENGLTSRCLKDYLEDESDYKKMIWHTEQIMDFDRVAALRDGRKLRDAAGDLGMLGTWVSPSASIAGIQSLFYHIADFPDTFRALREARRRLLRLQLETYRESGFDFMFYCVPGTDSISPGFFREWMEDETGSAIAWWKSLGGFTLWHGCGHVKAFVEQGIFNDMKPEIIETFSEPPVGDIPSLSWARKLLDKDIISKGNIPLDILLQGTPDDVREAVRRVKRETRGSRHVVGLSDNILNGTPQANLRAFVDEGYKL
jgi:hypothetical protein